MTKPTQHSDNKNDSSYSPMQMDEESEQIEKAYYSPMVVDEDGAYPTTADYQPMVVDAAQEANYHPMVENAAQAGSYQPMVIDDNQPDAESVDQPTHYGPLQADDEQLSDSLSKGKIKQKVAGERVISETGSKYQVYNRLSDIQSQKLRKETLLDRQNSNTFLGKGNFGSVLIAKQKASEMNPSKFVAVKVIQNEVSLFEKENTFYSIAAERKIEGLLVPIETIKCTETNTIYQFMPLANFGDGVRLAKELPNLQPKERDLVLRNVAAQLLQTTANMIDNHIYHLDMKPDNFLIDLTGKVYIADFGAAVAYDNNGKQVYAPAIIKTDSRYFSPEIKIVGGEARYRLIDQWRLGLTLAQLVCTSEEGKKFVSRELLTNPALRASNTYEQEVQHFQTLLTQLSDILDKENVPQDLKTVIKGLLNPNYTERLDPKIAIAMLNQPADAKEQMQKIFSTFAPKKAVIEVIPDLLISRKNLTVFSDLVKEVSHYSEKHRGSPIIEIKKRQVANHILHILSTKSVSDPTVIEDLKAVIAKEEIHLKHEHFHRIKSWLGKDVEIIAKTKKLVSALENKDSPPEPKWYHSIFNTMKETSESVQRKVRRIAFVSPFTKQKNK